MSTATPAFDRLWVSKLAGGTSDQRALAANVKASQDKLIRLANWFEVNVGEIYSQSAATIANYRGTPNTPDSLVQNAMDTVLSTLLDNLVYHVGDDVILFVEADDGCFANRLWRMNNLLRCAMVPPALSAIIAEVGRSHNVTRLVLMTKAATLAVNPSFTFPPESSGTEWQKTQWLCSFLGLPVDGFSVTLAFAYLLYKYGDWWTNATNDFCTAHNTLTNQGGVNWSGRDVFRLRLEANLCDREENDL